MSNWDQLKADAEYLGHNLDVLSAGDRKFADSLLTQFRERGISAKQEYWVVELAKRAREAQARKVAQREVQEIAAKPVIDLGPIVELFKTASTNLKKPFVIVETLDGDWRLRLKLAGPASRYAGQVYVYSDDRYEDRVWLGRVDPATKVYVPSRDASPNAIGNIEKTLVAFAADPWGTATRYGRKVGACCFCSRPLHDPRSVSMGYGPICAEHFGRPWGEVVEVPDFEPRQGELARAGERDYGEAERA